MLIQPIAPVAETDCAHVFVALELSKSKWLVGVGTPWKWPISRHQVPGGDLCALLERLAGIRGEAEKRCGQTVKVHVCFEAGRDGHWLYRALKQEDYDVYEIEPASVAVDRRARRAKSDGLDVEMLVRVLARLLRGEADACRIVRVPSEEEEDAKRPHREYERLDKERTGHRNRIKGLLFAQGIRDFDPAASDWPERLAALRILPNLRAEIERECRRLTTVTRDIAQIAAEMKARIAPPKKTVTRSAVITSAVTSSAMPIDMGAKIKQLYRLKGIGIHFSTVLGSEVYYRHFRNRRAVGQYLGAASSPFQSGDMARDQGISKAGNGRARKAMVELSWLWLQHQPDSALTQWFKQRVGDQKGRVRRIAIVALARKLAVALWRYLETGVVPEGAVLKRA
ncbi:MAG: IS110 family transposase [Parasulfuritortus sp.]|nr:IS110 family transposase [Parasulfuritortus sp.]